VKILGRGVKYLIFRLLAISRWLLAFFSDSICRRLKNREVAAFPNSLLKKWLLQIKMARWHKLFINQDDLEKQELKSITL
jgi:hypothetical protein